MDEDRLPTALWVDSHLHQLTLRGISFYIVNKGAHVSGIVILKLCPLDGTCKLLIQQRDLDGKLGWMAALKDERVAESEADAYIRRALDRDPDLWVIEIEDKDMKNPFDGAVIV
jgi:hypothetical protein